jgi:hypothetical protein
MRPRNAQDVPAALEDCIGGGYEFIIQSVGRSRSFTVQVYDDELALLGAALLRDAGKTDEEVAALEEQLVKFAQAFCGKYLSETQDKDNCRILRFDIGRLTNRNRHQGAQAMEKLPPDLEELLGEIE